MRRSALQREFTAAARRQSALTATISRPAYAAGRSAPVNHPPAQLLAVHARRSRTLLSRSPAPPPLVAQADAADDHSMPECVGAAREHENSRSSACGTAFWGCIVAVLFPYHSGPGKTVERARGKTCILPSWSAVDRRYATSRRNPPDPGLKHQAAKIGDETLG